MQMRCLAGTCVTVAPMVDADGDGHAPAPCGDDCDDTVPTTFTNARELCDSRDNDCDGEIDEGAPRLDETYRVLAGDGTATIVGWGNAFLVTEASSSALWGLPMGLDGTLGGPIELVRLSGGSAFRLVRAVANTSGQVLVVAVTDLGSARYTILEPTVEGGFRTIEGPAAANVAGPIQDLEVVAYGSAWALAYDAEVGGRSVRLVTGHPAGEPIAEIDLGGLPAESLGLATDGTHIVVSDDVGRVRFFTAAGDPAGFHELPVPLPRRPLASADGAVVAVVPDGESFDYALLRVTAAAGPGTPEPAPFGSTSDVVQLGSADGIVLVARSDSAGVTTVQAVSASDLRTYEGAPLSLGARGGLPPRIGFAEAGGAAAVLAPNGDGTSAVGVLMGCSGGR